MRYLLTVFFLFVFFPMAAGTVSGRVTDMSGRPVSGLVVGLEDNYYTSETSSDGSFRFENVDPGDYTLHFSNGTWGHHRYGIRVKTDFHVTLKIDRKMNTSEPLVYRETDEPYNTRQGITQNQIITYPMRGVGDSLHLLQTLPGVGGGSSVSTIPIIRSTNPLLNKYYIDGIPINNPYHFAVGFVPVISAISDPVIDHVILHKGDAPVSMGDHAGNVIDIRTVEPTHTGLRGSVILDGFVPLLPTMAVSGVVDPRWSLVAVGRRSTTDILLDIADNNYMLQDFYFKTTYVLNRSHRFRLIANGASETFKWDDFISESGYNLFAFQWDYRIARNLFLTTSISRYQVARDLNNDKEDGASVIFDPVEYRLYQALTAGIGRFAVTGGYEYTSYMNGAKSNISFSGLATPDILSAEAETQTTEFAIEGNGVRLFADVSGQFDRFWFTVGANFDYFGVQDSTNYGYQSEAGVVLRKTTAIYAKAGRFIAHPDMLYYLGAVDSDSENSELLTPTHLEDTITDTYAVGLQSSDFLQVKMRGELFYSIYQNLYPGGTLVTVNDDSFRKAAQLHKFALEDDGDTMGFELSLSRKFLRRYNSSLAYTFQTTTRNRDDNLFVDLLGDNAKEIESEYSQTHILRIMAAARFGPWVPALLFNAYSSLPYTEVSGTREIEGLGTQTLYGKENGARYPMHHRLDFKVNYYASESLRFYAEMWNVYLNRENQVADYKNRSHREVNDIPLFFWMGMELCF
ncbi:MAG: TonB-dependent receptor [Spirochaetes bacterium]|nr:TonB-dependent receptor [Spirochaetota bacterium]